ncbi:MAG: hypothetical protein ABIH34_01765 [Nanoarchaeota archaeon]
MIHKSQASSLREKNFRETAKSLRESVTSDQLIIQTLYSYDECNKAANQLTGRLRGWYVHANPELIFRIKDNKALIPAILKDTTKSQLGIPFTGHDKTEVLNLAKQCARLFEFEQELMNHIEHQMKAHLRNVYTLAGAQIGARLLSIAGSLKNLAEMPGSTIQLLGAEKALFRHLKNKTMRPPKYGILHEHPFIAKADKKRHGKIARALGDKIAIAARIDFFGGEFMGNKLLKQVEARR